MWLIVYCISIENTIIFYKSALLDEVFWHRKECQTESAYNRFLCLTSYILKSSVFKPLCLPLFLKYHTSLLFYPVRYREPVWNAGHSSCVSPSSLIIARTTVSMFCPSGFIISIVSPTENLFLCSMRYHSV